jgi:ABC-type uncharacterized transport system involved in gliding motility auxiliary subunit
VLGLVMEVHPDSTAVTTGSPTPGRAVITGNSEFLNNSTINLGGNRDLVLNMLGWLAREETLIELRGRDPLSQPVILSGTQKNSLLWGATLIYPLFVGSLILGIMLRHQFLSRRRSSE